MQFRIVSFEMCPREMVDTPWGTQVSYVAPRQPQIHPRRYNESLIYCAVVQLYEAGHTCITEVATPPTTNSPSVVSFEGLSTIGVYNSDAFIIQNLDTGYYVVVDMQDYPTFSRELSASPLCQSVYMTMYESEWVREHTKAPEKFRPFVYFAMYPEYTAQKELLGNPVDDRLFFAATLGGFRKGVPYYMKTNANGEYVPWRETAIYLKEMAPNETVIWDYDQKLPRELFWAKARSHTWNLFLPGGPWCNREHELWTLGIPTIGLTYPRHRLMVPLLPNVDYVAVEPVGGADNCGRPMNAKETASAILDRYRTIKNDTSMAVNVAYNARHRMLNYAMPAHVIKQVLDESFLFSR